MTRAVIFDIDGVLLDSVESNTQFFQKLLAEFGYRGPTIDEYRLMHHLTMWEVIKKITNLSDEKEVEKIWNRGHQPIPGANLKAIVPKDCPLVIEDLHKKYQLAVVSGRIKAHIFENELKNLKKYFSVAVGYEDTKNHKPNPEPLLLAAKKLNVKTTNCVYIGDALTDIEAGKSAGMKVILYSKNKLYGADAIAQSFAQIPKIIDNLF